jgi:hypothetical protein
MKEDSQLLTKRRALNILQSYTSFWRNYLRLFKRLFKSTRVKAMAIYGGRYDSSVSYWFSFQMWRRVEFLAFPTGRRQCATPSASLVLKSVTCFEHSISAKWRTLWSYVLGKERWLNFLLWKASVLLRFIEVWEVCMVRVPSCWLRRWVHRCKSGEKDIVDTPTSHDSDDGEQSQGWCTS